ncbi:tryptophan--tRNA ligase [Candidatus Saccharibacteria bacterium CG11_big_fil_rev_8_21_14_0_20_41_19]|nr:tryptophan--tRNA ligase [Candidatus Saccharibacteria bacterium]OIP86268.1 MAG: tryptophan--tRNA ligase [Candidatus Saccharibacteria bacterium CG2_30_41_52]PIQ71082.1 MAG: tryptophan--tRNA ligase [Candidatus Saccharibacteria bacterium CG11_big_fil_rev_8_21_14_0_20_41_19]PIZ59384.1 MAG: tryptophan--tRNA ligase [Candidatus Saccharibacteria bacterium CG_4_10_14_0_2_um_filter_41_11]PJC29501.1 MAG: tryptophan--tRNA ligase [Candidatus Saccharibacteria bacterium CG_4_9_14_0_2_um_filter_41_9]PJE6601
MTKPVILTGIRANEEPTIGNYLGAIAPLVQMQKLNAGDFQINMFVPDLHSFTTPVNHKTLYQNTLNNLKYFIASGLDINNPDTYIYRQSYISAHSELTWILDCFTYFGEMSRMTQFKEKSSEHCESVTVGLFNYPVLMAADILLYGAKYVPVGEDQFQHLEIARDIATRFNNKFGEIFVVPEATKTQTQFIQRDHGLRIRSLTDPTKKMSKSSDDKKSKILLIDNPDEAAKKIMSATTDSVGSVHFDWENQPGITSLLQILALLTGRKQHEVIQEWEGCTSYGEFKTAVADAVKNFLTDFQEKYNSISDEQLLAKLEQSERDLTPVANAMLLKAQQAVGLRPKRQTVSHIIHPAGGLNNSNSESNFSDGGISDDTSTTENLIMDTDNKPDAGDIMCETV